MRASLVLATAWLILLTPAASTRAQAVREARLDGSAMSSPVLRPLWNLDTGG